ncbi:phytoene desaturase [bacterium]|nr:phytoene desaturase [bacterium]
MKVPEVVVIGSGFSGLSAACFLARAGAKVTLVEKNATWGGRARLYEAQGFRFDMGPSWYWMPDVFERFFGHFGRKVSDQYTLQRLDPSYRIYFEGNRSLDVPASMVELEAIFEGLEPGSSVRLRQFLKESQIKYEAGIGDLVQRPGLSMFEYTNLTVLKGLLELDLLRSMKSYVARHFSHPDLVRLMEFPVLFLGAMPENTPALYSLMNYADLALGTWYPLGGMHKIVEAMVDLAESLGVQMKSNWEVTGFGYGPNGAIERVEGKTPQGISTVCCDAVVGGADYHHLDREVLEPEKSNYTERYWDRRKLAPSSLIFYIGLDRKLEGLLHHNLFFDADFGRHAREIYSDPRWPSDPLFYVCRASATDPTVAPEGMDNVFVLIPTAPGLEDTPSAREPYLSTVLQRIEQRCGFNPEPHIVHLRSYAHRDFVEDYHSYKGNAYGLANTLDQTAVLKPSIKSKKVPNLWFTGQLTNPGPGVPPALISGEVVSRALLKHYSMEL